MRRHTRLFMTAASVLAIAAGMLATPGVASAAVSYAPDGFYAASGLPDGGGFCITPGGTAPAGTYGPSGQTNSGSEATVMLIATQYGVVGAYDPSGSQISYYGVPAATGGTGYGGAALNPQADTITAEQIANDMTLGINDSDHSDSDMALVDGIYNFAKANPGPWYLKAAEPAGPYTEGTTYTATVTVTNALGTTVPISNLPLAVTGATGDTVTPTGPMTNGVAGFNFTPTASSWAFAVGSSGLANNSATEYQNVSDPSGYQTLTTPGTLSYATTFYGPATVTPQQQFGNLTIQKTDAATGAGLAGAVFDVTGPSFPNGTSVTTGSNGEYSFSLTNPLTLGTYTVTETTPPAGFQLANPATQTVDLTTTNTTATVTFADAPVTGGLSISKTDATGGAGLAGAVFDVTGPSYPSGTTVTTPSSGTVTLTGLTLGTYTVTETGAPPGFQLANPSTQTVDVASSATVPVAFSDAPQPATISTAVSAAALTVGHTLSDSITVGGIAANGGVADTTMKWALEGPVPMADGACAGANFSGAPTLDSGTISVPGDGTYSTGASPVLTVAGCYGYAETVAANAWTSGASSSPNASDEQATVAPTISTQAAESGPDVGSTISDAVTIAGLGSNPATVAWKVLGPVSSSTGSCAGLDWTGAPVAATGSYSPVDGTTVTGTRATDPVITVAGCYGYSDTLTSAAGYFTPITTSPSAVEAVYVAPTITTQAAESGPGVGSTMTDTATVAGLPTSGGTVTWTLLGPVAPAAAPASSTVGTGTPSTSTCAGLDWTGAPTAATGTAKVTADGQVILGPTPALPGAGCYGWADTLSSPAGAFLAVTAPISTAETAYLMPTLTTRAVASAPSAGSDLTDTATIAGLTTPATISWTVLGPIPPSRTGSCTGLDWSGAATAAHGTQLAVNGANTLPTKAMPDAGCYGFVDTLEATGTTPLFLPLTVGITAPETVYLTPSLITKAVSTPVNGDGPSVPGSATLTDQVTLTGVDPATTRISWTVYGPVTGEACTAVNWRAAPAFASGSEQVPGETFTITVPKSVVENGCYSFADTVTSTNKTFAPLVVHAGLVAETVAGSIGSAGASAPGLVNSGHPGPPVRGNWWWIGTGITVIALGLGLAVVAVTDRKRNKIA